VQAEAVCRGSWWRRHASHGATPRTPRYATRRAAPRQGRANDRDRRRRCLLPSFFFSLERVAVGASRSRLLKKNSTVNGLVDNVSRYVCTGGNARCNEESGRARERERKRGSRSPESRLTEVDRNFTDEGTTSQPPLPQRRFCLEKVRPHAVSSRLHVTISDRDCGYQVGARITIGCLYILQKSR